jgi:hypothetical protein
MTRYQSAMTALSTALVRARAPIGDRPKERESINARSRPLESISLPNGERRAQRRPSLVVRLWLAISTWAAGRDLNSHQ